jgi:dipeptidyl aminopeptidase/acylaminoacyl peptidase
MFKHTSYSIHRYLGIRSAYWPAFARDGRELFFISDSTGTPQVYKIPWPVAEANLPMPVQLTFEPNRVNGIWCSPVSGDQRLILTRDTGGDENMQLYLLDYGQLAEIPLTQGHESALHTFGGWSGDGRKILFAANRRNPALFDLYCQELGKDADLIWENHKSGFLENLVMAPDQQRLAVTLVASSFEHELFELDMYSGQTRRIKPQTGPVRFENVCYANDGRALYVTTDLNQEYLYLARISLETEEVTPLTDCDGDIENMRRSEDGRHIAFNCNRDGSTHIFLLTTASQRIQQSPTLPSSPVVIAPSSHQLAFSPHSADIVFSGGSATSPTDLQLWNFKENRIGVVTRSSTGAIPRERFTAPRLIAYPTFDCEADNRVREIPAWFFQPEKNDHSQPMPVVIMVHGGPESQFRPDFNFLAQFFLQAGYAVFAPNVRGSTGYGKTYSHLDDKDQRLDAVADLAYAAHWLRRQPGIDGGRLVLYGVSYGGFMVLSALANYPDLWAAGIDIVGDSNLATFLENTSDYRRAHREAEYGSLAQYRVFLERIAPRNQAANIRAPLIIVHGSNDPRVPVTEATELYQALKAHGKQVELIIFDDEGHGITRPANKAVAYQAIRTFLKRHVMSN